MTESYTALEQQKLAVELYRQGGYAVIIIILTDFSAVHVFYLFISQGAHKYTTKRVENYTQGAHKHTVESLCSYHYHTISYLLSLTAIYPQFPASHLPYQTDYLYQQQPHFEHIENHETYSSCQGADGKANTQHTRTLV